MKQAKAGKRATAEKTGRTGPRRATIAAALLLLAGCGLAAFDLARERRSELAATDASIHGLGRVAEALWGAEEERVQALLARLRLELRSNGCFEALGEAGGAGVAPEALRRIDNLLQRAVEGAPELVSFDLVVAGQKGMSDLRFVAGAGPLREDQDAAESEVRAKTLWYAEDVIEAVEANGRRVARSGASVLASDEGERALVRASIALHGADDVVQGVLVATLDLAPLGARLASLSTDAVRFALVTADGERVGGSVEISPEQVTTRVLALEPGAESTPEIVEEAGVRSALQPAVASAEVGRTLYFWIESDAPPSIAAAVLLGPWSIALAGLVFALGLACVRQRELARLDDPASAAAGAASRVGRPVAGADVRRGAAHAGASATDADDALGDAAGDAEPVVRRERFVLRDWLADVRGCLEREAASRGLTLVLRCERSLPREVEQDPLWLGGLLVSLGREALDATRATRVALEVSSGAGSDLRFELDAGGADLEPAGGMDSIVARLGGSFEKSARGRLAVILPDALA